MPARNRSDGDGLCFSCFLAGDDASRPENEEEEKYFFIFIKQPPRAAALLQTKGGHFQCLHREEHVTADSSL